MLAFFFFGDNCHSEFLSVVFICITLITGNAEHSFIELLATACPLCEEYIFRSSVFETDFVSCVPYIFCTLIP